MRFLFECVGLCMTTSNTTPADSPMVEPSSPATNKSEETKSLVKTPSAPVTSRRRKRTPAARSASADWRPSLFAISEDNNGGVVVAKKVVGEKSGRPKAAAAAVEGKQWSVKRCGASSGRVNGVRSHSRDYSYGNDPLQVAVPAFSAAPFMF